MAASPTQPQICVVLCGQVDKRQTQQTNTQKHGKKQLAIEQVCCSAAAASRFLGQTA